MGPVEICGTPHMGPCSLHDCNKMTCNDTVNHIFNVMAPQHYLSKLQCIVNPQAGSVTIEA